MANTGWFIIAPFGESTGSGLSGVIPKGSKPYQASGSIYTQLNNDFLNNNANPVIIGGQKWEAVIGPFPTEQDAISATPPSWQSVLAGAILGGAEGAFAAPGAAPGPIKNPVSSLTSWEQAIGNFFGNLAQANTWLRVGEVAIGVILIAVGIAKMTNAVGVATKIASVVK